MLNQKYLYLETIGGKNFVQRTLVSFDTDRIKGYVFGTDRLKEIRGASAILDRLNREDMREIAENINLKYEPIYANGGSGLFLVDANKEKAEEFAQIVQQRYREETKNGASITYIVQDFPSNAPQNLEALMTYDLGETLELLRYRMRMQKDCPSTAITLPSHPFMRLCTACGVNYAEKPGENDNEKEEEEEEGDTDNANTSNYCASCRTKRDEDITIKENIYGAIRRYEKGVKAFQVEEVMEKVLWERIIYHLRKDEYTFTHKIPKRPKDFNVFRDFSKSKEYIGLIYADGNNMGVMIDKLTTLRAIQNFSRDVDNAIHQAISAAIKEYLPIKEGSQPLFPFDVLLLGGDDLVMVTDASRAMDVALTIAKKFHELSDERFTLSVGVVLAPVKYPFSLLQDLAEETLKAAKKASAQARVHNAELKNGPNKKIDDTRISFLLIAGSSIHSYKQAMNDIKKETGQAKDGGKKSEQEFHATLRPYDPKTLKVLLDAIHKANTSGFNRSKLHQMREAILKMNLTTSVGDSLATLRNWQPKQREQVVNQLYEIGRNKKEEKKNEQNPLADFPRVTFPWFWDGQNDDKEDIYRTSILDFVELYDFVSREG